jgi:2-phosphoglycerate kinase
VVSLVKIKKRSEDFSKKKLKASIAKAGATDANATKIADKIAGRVKQGTTTGMIRRWVIIELRKLDQKVAEAYETYKKPTSMRDIYLGPT